VLLVFTITCS